MRKPIEKELRAPSTRHIAPIGNAGAASGKVLMTARERMWQAMRSLGRKGDWTISQVTDLAYPCELSSVKTYVDSLCKAGLVVRKQAVQGKNEAGNKWASIPHRLAVTWPQAPRVDRDGKVVTQGLGVLAMWRAARIRKVFTPSELARDATIGEVQVKVTSARQYCIALEKSGHFKLLKKGQGRYVESQYQLLKDTGPHAPAITRAKIVFDRNEGCLKPIESAQEVCDALN
jgi:hypothetical protein